MNDLAFLLILPALMLADVVALWAMARAARSNGRIVNWNEPVYRAIPPLADQRLNRLGVVLLWLAFVGGAMCVVSGAMVWVDSEYAWIALAWVGYGLIAARSLFKVWCESFAELESSHLSA